MKGFKKLMDSPECDYLLEKYPNAFLLLTLIAKRARRDDCIASMGLSKGQAVIGDYKKCGLTESKYRTAKNKLKEFGFAKFHSSDKGSSNYP